MKSLALLLLLLVAGHAAAGDELRCNPDGSQSEMNMCALDDFAAADKALNVVYRDVMACSAGNPVFVGKLKDAQRQWIRFRDAELAARFPVGPGEDERIVYGSMHPLLFYGEKTRLTRERTLQLRTYIEDVERNTHCDRSLLKEPGNYHAEDR